MTTNDSAPPIADPPQTEGQFQRELSDRVRWLFGPDHGSRLAIASCALIVVLLWAVDWTTYPTLDLGLDAWLSSDAMSWGILLPTLAVAAAAVTHRTIPKSALIGTLALVALIGTGLVLALVLGAPGGDPEDPAHWSIGPFLALVAVAGSGLGMVRVSRGRGVLSQHGESEAQARG